MKKFSSVMRRFLPQKIWQQIFLILVPFVVLPLVILGILLIYTSQDAIKATVLRDHREIAVHATGEISENIKGAQQALHVTAAIIGRLQAAPWRQETVIVELASHNPAFERISSVNADGREVVTSQIGTELRDYSGRESFRQGMGGQSYISPVKISSDNRIPFLTLAEPIRQSGKVTGVLIADLSLRGIWQLADVIKVGEKGKAYIIDERGWIIAHPDKKLVFQDSNITQSGVIDDLLRGESGNFEDVDEKGNIWLTSYAPIAGLNWGLIIAQPIHEVLASSSRMKLQSMVLILICLILVIIFSLIVAKLMSRPMNDIIDNVRRMAGGEFPRTFRIRRNNEMGRLLFSLNRMQDKLYRAREAEKLSGIGKTAGAIAHELKNSLLLVQTFIELLPEKHKDKKFINEFSEIIPKELDAWNTSLRNMMGLLKDADVVADVDINSLMKEVALLVKLKARQKHVHFEMSLQDDLPLIRANHEKLKQVFLNLVNNAFDAIEDGGMIAVRTRWTGAEKIAGDVEIEIVDTGEGIKKENLDKIFDPFFSTKSGGLGLGLSICRDVVQGYRGTISVESHEHHKTVFTVKLPASLEMDLKVSQSQTVPDQQ